MLGCSPRGPRFDCTQLDLTCSVPNLDLILIIHTFGPLAGTITWTETATRGTTNGINPITQVAAAGVLFCLTWARQTFA